MENQINTISATTSSHINNLRFILIVMVVAIHTILIPDTNISSGPYYNVLRFLHPILLVSNSLFFFISGYLFFFNCDTLNDCSRKIKKRIKTLLVPFLIWNTLYWAFYSVLACFAPSMLGDSLEPLQNITLPNFWKIYLCFQGNLLDSTPIVGPFWFLRDLIFLVLLTPVIRILLEYKYLTLLVALVTAFLPFGSSTPYFLLGCLAGRRHIDFISFSNKCGLMSCGTMIVAVALFVCFGGEDSSPCYKSLFFLKSFLGIIALSYLTYKITQRLKKNVNVELVKSVFIVFALHYLIARPLTKIGAKLLLHFDANSLFYFVLHIVNVIVAVAFCYLAYKVLRKVSPKLCELLGAR